MKSRQIRLMSLGVAVAALLAAGCSSSSSSSSAESSQSAASQAPIKIGLLVTLSGPLGASGPATVAGAQVAINQANAAGGVHGHKLELVTADDGGSPTQAVAGLESLAGKGVHFLIAGGITPICSAEFNALQRVNMLMMIEACTDDSDTGPSPMPDVFRAEFTNGILMTAAQNTLCGRLTGVSAAVGATFSGVKSYDILNANYDITNAQAAYMKQMLSTCGITLRKQVEVPLTATDTLPYISSLENGIPSNSASNTVLVLNEFGSALLNAIKVGVSTNLFKHYKYVLSWVTDDTQEIAAQASLGSQMPTIYQINDYFSGLPGSVNAAFVQGYKALMNGALPGDSSEEPYRDAQALIAALRAASSDTVAAVEQAAAGVSFDTVTGEETIGSDHQGTVNLIVHSYSPSGNELIATLSGASLSSEFTPADQALGKSLGL